MSSTYGTRIAEKRSMHECNVNQAHISLEANTARLSQNQRSALDRIIKLLVGITTLCWSILLSTWPKRKPADILGLDSVEIMIDLETLIEPFKHFTVCTQSQFRFLVFLYK